MEQHYCHEDMDGYKPRCYYCDPYTKREFYPLLICIAIIAIYCVLPSH